MAGDRLLARLRDPRGPMPASLDACLDGGAAVWDRLHSLVRREPGLIDDAAVAVLARRAADAPGSCVALLLAMAAGDEARRAALVDRCLELVAAHPEPGLRTAGYHLHEHHRLLDGRWLAAARDLYHHHHEGAWGIVGAAAMYESRLVDDGLMEWFAQRWADAPHDHAVVLLSLARERPALRVDLLRRVLATAPAAPAAVISGAALVARDEAVLLTPELIGTVLEHLHHAPDKAWELFSGASRACPALFSDALLDALEARTAAGPGTLIAIVRHLMEVDPPRARALSARYVGLVARHPAQGIQAACHDFQHEHIALVGRDLMAAVCAGFAAAAYPAYQLLRRCVDERPELIGAPEVEAAVRNIPHATNYAFGFFQRLLAVRPEFTSTCALAVFECLAQEPVNRSFMRVEEMEAIVAIAEAAHVHTGLERALREPPQVGSRRARALMAIMFRQKLRARRHVLLEALRYAATVRLWRPAAAGDEGGQFSPIWDFALFIIDHAGDGAVSTADAERFLEGAFQLKHLYGTGAECEAFLRRLDLERAPSTPFPPEVAFLAAEEELAGLHDLVHELGRRFAMAPRLAPLADFAGRRASAEAEVRALEGVMAGAGAQRPHLEARRRSLAERIGWWSDPAYGRALHGEEPPGLPEPARRLARRERKELVKQARDALRAEAIRIAVATVERTRLDLYRQRLEEILGRAVDITQVAPDILPAFLWFPAIGHLSGNTRWLKRLIEDRIAGLPHLWLREEPPARRWADRVRRAQPAAQLERWRAPFSRTFSYRPGDALGEKRRRIRTDLAKARALLERAGAQGLASDAYEVLAAALAELRSPPAVADGETAPPPIDPALLDEVAMDLERVRLAEATPDSDFAGSLIFTVESDPFQILFMGEYGFASCLSLRGINAWSAVSNAIDIDKAIVWAREPGGNVVGRRLLALVEGGVLSFRTYTNRHGLGLDGLFDRFIAEYAAHCGVPVAHAGHPEPLLSDRWYDDGAV